MAKVIRYGIIFQILTLFNFFILPSSAFEIIRDVELEQFTDDIFSIIADTEYQKNQNFNIYFIKSDQVNAFVTAGQNIFINTELIIKADDYREYAAVLAHELAHIEGGHIFNTSIEISNLNDRAIPVYLLGIIGIMAGSAETGLAGIMVGQASVTDGYAYYSRTQEASADQAAVKILCDSGIDANFLISFLNKLERVEEISMSDKVNYKSTHPLTKNRTTWIKSSIKNQNNCKYDSDAQMNKRFDLLKAKLHGFTHSHNETESIYSSKNEIDLYATAVSNYFIGNHATSIKNLKELIILDPTNPFYNELLGEIYFTNNEYEIATKYQNEAIYQNRRENDLYYMMLGNYLLSFNQPKKTAESIRHLKKSIQLNSRNAYSWYLLARAYAEVDKISLANYATAERYFLVGERKLSYDFAVKALENIAEYSPEWYRSSDLINILEKEVLLNKQ